MRIATLSFPLMLGMAALPGAHHDGLGAVGPSVIPLMILAPAGRCSPSRRRWPIYQAKGRADCCSVGRHAGVAVLMRLLVFCAGVIGVAWYAAVTTLPDDSRARDPVLAGSSSGLRRSSNRSGVRWLRLLRCAPCWLAPPAFLTAG